MAQDTKYQNGKIMYGRIYGDDDREFYLPHSCDEWVIGDLEDAKKFVKDLLETIEQVESFEKEE